MTTATCRQRGSAPNRYVHTPETIGTQWLGAVVLVLSVWVTVGGGTDPSFTLH